MFREIGSKQLPRFLKKYFWETDFDKLTLPIHQFYVIERVLEYGDDEAIHWVKETFPRDVITRVVRESRNISRNTANLWGLLLDIPKEEIACFSKSSLLQRGNFSKD